LTAALAAAALAAGAEIRTGVAVTRIAVRDEGVVGIETETEHIDARTVVSAVDPRTTYLQLIHPEHLMPDFIGKMRNYRAAGTVAKINLALSALPSFMGTGATDVSSRQRALSGRIHIGPDLDYLERAFDHVKYGEFSAEPWLDISIPSLLEPGLAPAGAHVASIYVHYAPYRLRAQDWNTAREGLLTATMNVLDRHAPGIRALVVAAQVITPADLESEYGFAGGHIFHGELSIDQLFTMRPLLGMGQYGGALRGLFLCGAGTHPGGFMSGASARLAAGEVVRAARR